MGRHGIWWCGDPGERGGVVVVVVVVDVVAVWVDVEVDDGIVVLWRIGVAG